VLTATEWNRVTRFTEKPAVPDTLPGKPGSILASMGIYIFNTRLLEQLLIEDAADAASAHDFGKNILPKAIGERQVFAYPFQDVKTRAQSYWRDVGTIDAFYDANLELVTVKPELNIYDQDWPIWTYQEHQPPAKFILDEDGRRGSAINSMVSGGCIISGAVVRESMMFSDVRVDERSRIERSVILPHVSIGKGCVVCNAIVDEGCEIPDGMTIGADRKADAERFFVTDKGVVLVTVDMLRKSQAPT
jgi:glucose-1-phosphate adenylyltransferase